MLHFRFCLGQEEAFKRNVVTVSLFPSQTDGDEQGDDWQAVSISDELGGAVQPKYTIQWKPVGDHVEVTIPELGITVSTQPGEASRDTALDVAHHTIIAHLMERRESHMRFPSRAGLDERCDVKTHLTLVWGPGKDD